MFSHIIVYINSSTNFQINNMLDTEEDITLQDMESTDAAVSSPKKFTFTSAFDFKPHFRYYAECSRRLATFKDWPKYQMPSAEKLSRAGFIYLQKGDVVQCAWCAECLKDWHEDDCPWEEHKRLSPSCKYLKLCYIDGKKS